jgi:hypothetical protein
VEGEDVRVVEANDGHPARGHSHPLDGSSCHLCEQPQKSNTKHKKKRERNIPDARSPVHGFDKMASSFTTFLGKIVRTTRASNFPPFGR